MPIRTVALMVGGSQDFLKPRIARTFFFRYHYCGVPKHMEYLEEARHHMSCAPAEPNFFKELNWVFQRIFRGSIPDFSGKINMKAPLCHFQKKVSCNVQIFPKSQPIGATAQCCASCARSLSRACGRKKRRATAIPRNCPIPFRALVGFGSAQISVWFSFQKLKKLNWCRNFLRVDCTYFSWEHWKEQGILILSTCTTYSREN